MMSLMGVCGPINGTSDRSKMDSTSGKPRRIRSLRSCSEAEKIQVTWLIHQFFIIICLDQRKLTLDITILPKSEIKFCSNYTC